MVLLLVVSVLPPTLGGQGGVLGHLLGYGIFVLLLRRWQRVGPAVLLAWGYGALIEAVQWALPYRSAESIDLVVNGVGVAGGLLVDRLWPRRQVSSSTTS
ncbi:MAG: VanZ family protein [Armatimonadota bacterium]|nr:VanZ family protein [Armatimonadota bacterium]MDR7452525.1 VanZ family protein [Armatimonadota bacterium]MDR7467752.1 VanZ family protein [Armatimonadota bacterium]MDR7494952.1 VanZ family protein [Armatimonadota bacterium]MDR7499783.1 VanZ family protein [Armatimonadota bacterium]